MMHFKRTNAEDLDFKSLVIELDKDLWLRYPEIQQNFAPHNKIDKTARVIVAYEGVEPVGCACFKPMDEAATLEIKRMYVVPASRGKGIAKLILNELEVWGKEEGFSQSKLETGNNQPEATRVYERCNYKQIPNYPPYTNIKESICMAKALD